jgi:hypothetical protein
VQNTSIKQGINKGREKKVKDFLFFLKIKFRTKNGNEETAEGEIRRCAFFSFFPRFFFF